MDEYLPKPIRPEELKRLLDTLHSATLLRSLGGMERMRATGVEGVMLSGDTEQLRHESCFSDHVVLSYPSYSSLANHMKRFNALEGSPCTREGVVAFG